MPKAEVGSTKWLSNNMKSKGLQRLRWYCQACQRQMRDENGFKQHTMSEGHIRAMLTIGEDPRKHINEFSNTFKKDFLRLLKTAHGEKKVHANHFYQEYIADKEHIHMNSTKWPSLTEFVKYLGREGICRVEEGERGLEIAWVDDSPEALRRRENVLKKERMEKGDEERQARLLEAQIKRAQEQKAQDAKDEEARLEETKLERPGEQMITFNLGAKAASKEAKPASPPTSKPETGGTSAPGEAESTLPVSEAPQAEPISAAAPTTSAPTNGFSMSMGGTSAKPKPVNVFSSKGSSNPLKQKAKPVVEQPKKVSELERIMKRDQEEQERRRLSKRPRLG